ncbi:hypothetical protein [Fulvivirga sp.]|jgi:outer membrane immunogenic protein|uniref:hypothetical protein n=1 Tax=Fulvivirga sp. TaxID=1931237 RepID=UPI0032EBD208
MKKVILLSLLLVGCFTSYSQTRLGGGLSYGTDVEELGLNLNGEFFLKSNLALSPEFNYFFIDGPGSFWTINADGHFYFNRSSQASFYGLGGINLATAGFDGNTDTELGVNLGAGANFELNKSVTPFAQLKFVVGNADQAVFSFGVRFDLN